MNDLGPGFPEWTELGQDGGLDPLGMQRPIEAIYQSLLPGIVRHQRLGNAFGSPS